MDTSQRIMQLRETVTRDLAQARDAFDHALRPEAPNVFVWHGKEFWVDRVRRLVASTAAVAAWRSSTTLPDDGELGEARNVLEVYGGSARFVSTGEILELLSWLVCSVEQHHVWTAAGAHVLNLAIAQPSINPAFEPLFWLALADDSGPRGHRASFYELVGPMIYDLMTYPEPTPGPRDVRRAQIAFLERLFPGVTDPGCEQLSDARWAERCDDQLRRHQAFVDDHAFFDLLSHVGAAAREPGARPFP